MLVHGDDYVTVATRSQVKWLEKEVKKRFCITASCLSLHKDDVREIKILNRMIRIDEEGLSYEADPRHHEIILDDLKLANAKGVVTPGTKDEAKGRLEEEPLQPPEDTGYRAVCARSNYLAQDRSDLLFSSKECSRRMAAPTKGDKVKLKRIGRYLVDHGRVVTYYPWQWQPRGKQEQTWKVTAYSDSDWAGCSDSRKSTSGGLLMVGRQWIKSWSRTQALVALSSGEAELYAMVKASAELLGLLSLLRDWGIETDGEVMGDAAACLGIIQRKGLGRLRHIQTNYLWVQQRAALKELTYNKVKGAVNPADFMTKYLSKGEIEKHMRFMGCHFEQGRAKSAPKRVTEHGWQNSDLATMEGNT